MPTMPTKVLTIATNELAYLYPPVMSLDGKRVLVPSQTVPSVRTMRPGRTTRTGLEQTIKYTAFEQCRLVLVGPCITMEVVPCVVDDLYVAVFEGEIASREMTSVQLASWLEPRMSDASDDDAMELFAAGKWHATTN